MEILFILGFLLVVLAMAAFRSPRGKGARGEARVNRAVRKRLDQSDATVLEDLTLPARGGTTQMPDTVFWGPRAVTRYIAGMPRQVFSEADVLGIIQTLRQA